MDSEASGSFSTFTHTNRTSAPNHNPGTTESEEAEILQIIIDANPLKSNSCKSVPKDRDNPLATNSAPAEKSQPIWGWNPFKYSKPKNNNDNTFVTISSVKPKGDNAYLSADGWVGDLATKEIDYKLVVSLRDDLGVVPSDAKMKKDRITMRRIGFYHDDMKKYYFLTNVDNSKEALELFSVNLILEKNYFRLHEGDRKDTFNLMIPMGQKGKANDHDLEKVQLPGNRGIRSFIPFKPYEWNYLIVIFEDNSILKQKININEIKPNQIELDQRVKEKFDTHKINIGQYCVLNNRYLFGALSLKVESSGLTSSHEGSKSSISNLILNKSTSGDQSTTVASYVSNNNPYANITTSDAIASPSPSPTRKDKLPEKEKEFSAFILIDASSENWSDPSVIKYFEKEEDFKVFGLNRIHYFPCRERGVILFEYSTEIVSYVLLIDEKDQGTKILRCKDGKFKKPFSHDTVIEIKVSTQTHENGNITANVVLRSSEEGKDDHRTLTLFEANPNQNLPSILNIFKLD